MNENTKKTLFYSIIILIFVIIIANHKSEEKEYRCASCDRVYTNREDTRSIARTNFCKPCYDRYKSNQKMIEEVNKYYERNR